MALQCPWGALQQGYEGACGSLGDPHSGLVASSGRCVWLSYVLWDLSGRALGTVVRALGVLGAPSGRHRDVIGASLGVLRVIWKSSKNRCFFNNFTNLEALRMASEHAQRSWRVLGRFGEVLRGIPVVAWASFGCPGPSRNARGASLRPEKKPEAHSGSCGRGAPSMQLHKNKVF